MRNVICSGLVLVALAALVSGPGKASAADAEAAGTVVLATGQVDDTAADGTRRTLKDGDTVYSGDTLTTGADSYTDLQYDDDARMMLRPGTQFQIEKYHFEPSAHPDNAPAAPAAAQENAFFRLIRGGLRTVSGLIGHERRETYRLDTPVVTIGVRGTEYEVRYCAGDCGDEAENGKPPADGLYTGVDKGAIAVSNQTGEKLTAAGQYGYARDARTPVELLKAAPAALRHVELPEKYKKLEEERERRGVHRRLDEKRRLRRHRHSGG